MTEAQELLTQLSIVVDLAVEHDRDLSSLVEYRLLPAGQVDDGEPPHREADAALVQMAIAIGAATTNRGVHALEQAPGKRLPDGDESADAAHQPSVLDEKTLIWSYSRSLGDRGGSRRKI